jgi:hypothetical protein
LVHLPLQQSPELPAKTPGERLASIAKPAPLGPSESGPPAVASCAPPSPFVMVLPDVPPHAATIAATTRNVHLLLMIMPL